jgi:hypothetical protein
MKYIWSRLIIAWLISFSFAAKGSAVNQICSPAVGANCTYEGCQVQHAGGLSFLYVTECTEVCCALCNDQVEILVYGAPLAGAGACSSTAGSSLCVGGDWCTYTRGQGGLPNPCDPPRGHGRIDYITAGDTKAVRWRPSAWTINLKGEVFLLIRYEPKKSIIEIPDTEAAGLYFVTSADEKMVGRLALDRRGLAYSISHLLSVLNGGGEVVVNTKLPDTSLAPDAARSAPFVKVGKWAADWRETPVLQEGYFAYSPYPRLMHRGRPATMEDLQAAGLDPQPVP